MKRKIITTKDGSKTIHIEDWNEQYHSTHGAIQEAKHVFLKHGLAFKLSEIENTSNPSLSILEIGFGTGLNALLTFLESQKHHIPIAYTGVEAYPVSLDEISELNYAELLSTNQEEQTIFKQMHTCVWEKPCFLSKEFSLTKVKMFFKDITFNNQFDVIYFDAFGSRVQPELWEVPIFKRMYKALKNKGVLVTYSAKGSARRAMQEVGFQVEKLPGPPGKREMLRAIK
ncbi:tRNA (5-methylaminomethyl-2-thiouridine)(34)-methyltransferase MnmD [Mangrovimonas spongiae]|uniref:SAM-dependent methyltransferase n=1 Tax=Mangrovimonas spongiae TaxID=2494697 RepID=A0A428K2T2_9FLAO|nr:tRNA (5-methylaminomethyl-2-thiouridine)(34)-methyltransferase MnmD [Mangrovimonas spongiae]RSK40732.1 SAM-dependent methyltransferase [Mangrovimonas spongiae]